MNYQLVSFGPGLEADFERLHCPANEAGWCFCVAWWVESWDGWGERTAEQNYERRQALLAAGEYDGYLLFDEQEPIAWCQVGPRDRLVKLADQMALEPDPTIWAITCFLVKPAYRGLGVAGEMLRMVLVDLQGRGIQTVEAYPKRGPELEAADLWNGPETIFLKAGFGLIKAVGQRAVWRLTL